MVELEQNVSIRGSLDLLMNSLLNAVVQVFSTEPTGVTADGQTVPQLGMIGYNSVVGKFGVYNGSTWKYSGDGDMLKSVYDTSNNGNVDTADNALLLQGQNLAYVLNLANATGTLNLSALPSHASTHKFGGADLIKLNELGLATADVTFSGYKATNIGNATADSDAVNLGMLKQYITGSRYKADSVRCVATSNITLSGFQTIDGQVLASGDANLRVLVAGNTTASQNGLYNAGSGTWSRTTDGDSWDELVSAVVVVEQGTTYKDTQWMCTVDRGGTLGTTSITWLNLPSMNDITAGDGLTKTGNNLAVNVDNQSIEIPVDTLQVKLNAAGAISKSASGLAVNVSTSGGTEISSNTVSIIAVNRVKCIRLQFTADGTTTYWDITGIGLGAGAMEGIGTGGARQIVVMKRSGTTTANYVWTQVFPEIQMRHSSSAASIAYRVQFAKAPVSGTIYEVIAERSYA